jgi:Protein of unknown function (DUF4242)
MPSPPTTLFLVERYLPASGRVGLEAAVARLAQICADLSGPTLRYLQSVYLPGEDTCFCVFEATSAEAVLAVNSAANFPLDRITAGIPMLPPEP